MYPQDGLMARTGATDGTMRFGTRLRTTREKRRLGQGDLAKLTGLSQPTISRYERGESVPEPWAVDRLAVALAVDADVLHKQATAARRSVVAQRDHQPTKAELAAQIDRLEAQIVELHQHLAEVNAALSRRAGDLPV